MSTWSSDMTKQQMLDYAEEHNLDLGGVNMKNRHDEIVAALEAAEEAILADEEEQEVTEEASETPEVTPEALEQARQIAVSSAAPSPAPPPRPSFPGEELEKFVTEEFCSLAYIDAQLKRTLKEAGIGPEEVTIIWANAKSDNYLVLVDLPGAQFTPTVFQLQTFLADSVARVWSHSQGPEVAGMPEDLITALRELDARCHELGQRLAQLTQAGAVTKAAPHGAYVAEESAPSQTQAAPSAAPSGRMGRASGQVQQVQTFAMPGQATRRAVSRREQMRRVRDGLAVGAPKPSLAQISERYHAIMASCASHAQASAKGSNQEPVNE